MVSDTSADEDDEVLVKIHAQRVVARAAASKLTQLIQNPEEEGVSSEAVKRLKREMKEALNLLRMEREHNARSEQTIDSLRKQLAKATPAKFKMMEREFETAKKQLALSRRVEALTKEHAAEQKVQVTLHTLKVRTLEEQIKGLNIAREQAQAAAASRLSSKTNKQREEEEAQRKAAEELHSNLQELAMSIKEERDTLAERNRELEHTVKYLESELASLRESLNAERTLTREATAKQIEQELQLATSIAELTKANLDKNGFVTSLEQMRDEVKSCRKSLADAVTNGETLARNVMALNASVKSTKEEIATLSAKLAVRDAQRGLLLMSRWRAILRLLQAKRWLYMLLYIASDTRSNAIRFAQQRASLYAVAEQKSADERKVLMEMRMLQEEDNALIRQQCEHVKHDSSLVEQELATCKLQLRHEVEWAISMKSVLVSLFDQFASAQQVFREIDVNLFRVLGQVRSHVDLPIKYVLEHPCQPAELELLHQGVAVFRTRLLSDELVAGALTRIDELFSSEPSLPVDVAAEVSMSLAAVSFEQLRITLSKHQRTPSAPQPAALMTDSLPSAATPELHEIPQGWAESCRPSSASLPSFPMRPSSVSSVRTRPQSPPRATVLGTTDGALLDHAASATSPSVNAGKLRKHKKHAESAQVIPDATAVSSPVMLQITQALLACLASHRVMLRWPELVETIKQALHISDHAASTLARKALNKQRPTTASEARPVRPQSACSLRAVSPATILADPFEPSQTLPAKTVVARVPQVSSHEPAVLTASPASRLDPRSPKSPLQRALLHSFGESTGVGDAANRSLQCSTQSFSSKMVPRQARNLNELAKESSLEDSYRICDRLYSGVSPISPLRTKG
jgi:hypothetical protein